MDSKHTSPPVEKDLNEEHGPESQKGEVPQREVGGRAGPEPTRDWEKGGRCIDF
jgi:hypothetical protein